MNNAVADLSSFLQAVVAHELSRGNKIVRIDRPAGSTCPLAVIFEKPLDFAGFKATAQLPQDIRTWENRDSHYPLEAGYACEKTKHAVAGPLVERSGR